LFTGLQKPQAQLKVWKNVTQKLDDLVFATSPPTENSAQLRRHNPLCLFHSWRKRIIGKEETSQKKHRERG
jgi:hypothetical protein